ncbi:MAG: protein YceG like [Candidatus Kapaibacterium sp.]|nr:MAG: protein YceG like [Candidatus Kapabacteria bacterium]
MKKRTKKKLLRVLYIIFAAVVAPLLIFVFYSLSLLNKQIQKNEILVKISKNATTRTIVEEFNKYGALQPKELFVPLIRAYSFATGKIPVAGTYKFSNYFRNIDIIRAIFSGRQLYTVKVTYPEGITIKDFARITQKELGIDVDSFYKAIEEGNYVKKLNIPINSIEGYLMPETYFFYYGTDAENVVRKLIETQNRIWEEKFEGVCKEMGISRHFVLTLASIIELESPLKEERKRISGVFYNRLQKGMKLESDPTVQYALNSKKRIRFEDLDVDNLYNTYKYEGLPPGPICSPGVSSIEAAIYPEKHNFLYFVAYGDGSGRHRFARTFEEHLKNKALYKRELRKQISATK